MKRIAITAAALAAAITSLTNCTAAEPEKVSEYNNHAIELNQAAEILHLSDSLHTYEFSGKELILPDWIEFEELFCMELDEAQKGYGIYNPDELTTGILQERTPEYLIVERCIGKVLDTDCNGKILNTASKYDYISYKNTVVKPGNVVLTYLIYNPNNNYEDDIIDRLDFIIE